MRLDHLLSTENSGFRLEAGACPGRVERFHGPFGDAGVEEIVGLGARGVSGSGMGVLLGSRTATPQWFPLRCGSMPITGGSGVVRTSGGGGGAWRFENWIVDASEGGRFRFPFAYRDFARLRSEFGFEIDRFVIILV